MLISPVKADVFRKLPVESVKPLVTHLLAQLPEENSPVVIAVKPEKPASSSVNGQSRVTRGVVYEPAVVFVLELATLLAIRDKETVAAVGPAVAEALQSVVRDALNIHPTAVARAVYLLLMLLKSSQVTIDFLNQMANVADTARNTPIYAPRSFYTLFQASSSRFKRNVLD